MYEHTIRVPLIFAGPGVPAGKQFVAHAYLRDIFPTLCDLTGLALPEVDGRSQLPVMQGQSESRYDFTIGYFRDSQRMIRTDQWKLIQYPLVGRTQLFDHQADPLEMKNLADDPRHQQTRKGLSDQLGQWMSERRDARP